MPTVLFIMPFATKVFSNKDNKTKKIDFDKKYKQYQKIIEDVGDYKVYRVDESHITDIDFKMFIMIKKADIVFADLTFYNPNVMYELGVRHALKSKITIMFKTYIEGKEIPFNINHFNINKPNIFENKEMIKKLLESRKNVNDSPVHKNLENNNKVNPFEHISNAWNDFKIKYEELRKEANYSKLNKLIKQYDKKLSGIEAYDQKKALIIYKNDKSKGALQKALKIIQKYDPLNNNEYETIGLYASITRKIYEKEQLETNRRRATNAAYYFLAKHQDSYSISSYYMFILAMMKNEKITYQYLILEFRRLKEIIDSLQTSNDDYLLDSQKTINFMLSKNCELKKKDFKYPESSWLVYLEFKKIKNKYSNFKNTS